MVDIDDKYGKLGTPTWQALQLTYGDTPPTRVHRTPSGGRHFLFRQPGGIRNTPLDRSCIDIRGIGGLILGPGSVIDGKPYTVEHMAPIAELPAWVAGRILAHQHERKPAPENFEPDTPWAVDQARQEIGRWVSKGWIPEQGSRNSSVATMAARLHGLGISEDKAVEMIDEFYIPHGLAPDEATAFIVHSSYRNPNLNPAGSELHQPGSAVHGGLAAVMKAAAAQVEDRLWRPRDFARMPRITFWDSDRLLPRLDSGVGVWFGPTENHKTSVILCKCIDLLSETDISILYLCGEGKQGVGPRFTAQLLARGIDPDDSRINDRFASHYVPSLIDPGATQYILDKLDHEQFRPKLVFMDTMTTALLGFDEDNKSAAQLTRNGVVGRFASEIGALVMLVGHTSASTGNRLRGAQGFQDNVDVMIGQLANRRDNAAAAMISTFGDDGGKQKDGTKVKLYYALDQFNGMVVPRKCDKLEYVRLCDADKYDFTADEVQKALYGIVGYENGVTSKIVCMRMFPKADHEDPEKANAFWNRQAARLEKQRERHTSFNNVLSGGGSTVPLLWFLVR